ncbi:hypothetical protein SR39_01215 [Methylobacterium radiotolerans]|jgi:hypothetical protein|nr:hypothetical protein SR39_01215 [Methylobacterium radiotolerans]
MSEQIINTLKLKLVAFELAKLGITDQQKIIAIASRTEVDESGAIVGLKADGNYGVGSGANYHLSIADVAADMGESVSANGQKLDAAGQVNPFQKGPNFNLTAQAILIKSDPELAEHFQYLAGIGRA